MSLLKPLLKTLLLLIALLPLMAWALLWYAGGFEQVKDLSIQKDYLADMRRFLEAREYKANKQVFFGDLHIHTSYSSDAYLMGVRTLPEDAYRFAKGEVIEHGAGYKIQISRPLDFAAVTDHAEYLGQMKLSKPDVPLETQTLKDILENKNRLEITIDWLRTTLRIAKHYFKPFVINEEASETAWQSIIDVAETFYEPDVFTTFIAYEWSSQPGGSNLHRNVIYRGGADAVPDRPFSALDSLNPEVLLATLERQKQSGMEVLAIPHNGNLSNGKMYGKQGFNGEPMTEEYARLRAEMEPINEILQVKGASETHPLLSNLDEFADFEIFESNMSAFGEVAPPAGSYARDALRTGMEMYHDEGFNPYKFGVIGASDGHNSSSPVEENKFHGKLPMMDGAASLRMNTALLLPDSQSRASQWGSGGLAAVWAERNSRDSLFDAMLAKETYATSGTRIVMRFFAAAEFSSLPQGKLNQEDVTEIAYQQGVAMGSDLALAETEQPEFIVWAEKDPDGANLDRIQIIKMWVDSDGKSHEHIYDVALSDEKRRQDGEVEAVGNTVNISEASYENSIGTDYLEARWQDPDFDVSQTASYYARVLEIPTPRWSTYDAKTLGIEALEPATIQERAISSAIWYQPNK